MSTEEAHKFLKDVFDNSKKISEKLKTDPDDQAFIDAVSDGKFTADELRIALKEELGASDTTKSETAADKYAVPLVRFSFSESPRR